jgi:transposase
MRIITMHTTDAVAGLLSLPSPEQLPNDIGILKSMLVELVATLQREQRDKQALQHRLHLLLQRLYGPRGERFNPNQLLLFAELAEGQSPPSPPADLGTPPEKKQKRRCRPHGRRLLPDNLPHETKHHELPAAARICPGCGQQRIDIGVSVRPGA